MQQGLLVETWPVVLGCEAAGVITEIGEGVGGFKVGDRVFGVVKVGFSAYMAFQEFVSLSPPSLFQNTDMLKFLMGAETAFRTPENVSDEQAATLSVAFLVCADHP